MLCYRNDDQCRSELPKRKRLRVRPTSRVAAPAMHVIFHRSDNKLIQRESEMAAVQRESGGCLKPGVSDNGAAALCFCPPSPPCVSTRAASLSSSPSCTVSARKPRKATVASTTFTSAACNAMGCVGQSLTVSGRLPISRLFNGITDASRIRSIPRWEHCGRWNAV